MDSGCMDCGLRPEYAQVLEFDHRPDEEKLFHISDRMTTGTVDELLAEIAKCDVVCANCHRVRTVTKNQFGQALGTTRTRMSQVYKDRLAGIGHIWENSPEAMAGPLKHPDQLELNLFAA
jgi:crotonobetainyl-CoA:carnitine CoA-transferase CaiB-like acyl-CoA transferase